MAANNNAMILAQVRLPMSALPGQKLHIQLPQFGKTKFQICVPPGVRGGQTIKVNVPRPNARLMAVQAQRDQRLQTTVGDTPTYLQAPQAPQPAAAAAPPQGPRRSASSRAVAVAGGAGAGGGNRGGGARLRPPLWQGWFLKQQPHWPHSWQRRYGHLVPVSSNGVPAADGRFGHELRYGKEPSDVAFEHRGGASEGAPDHGLNSVRSLPIGSKPMCPSGRLAMDAAPGTDGKLQMRLSTAQRDYTLAITPAVEGLAFYRAVRVLVCGDDPARVDAALGPGPGANVPRT
jgi:hypothetical protein